MKRLLTILATLVILCVGSANAQYNQRYISWASRNFLAADNYKDAIDILNILLRANKDSHEAYYLRGYAKLGLGDLLGAEADLTEALRLNPVYTEAYHYRGIVRSELGNYEDAVGDFAAAIDLRPDLPNSYYSRGVTHLRNKNYVKSLVDFDAILRFTDKDAQTHINRGVAFLNLADTLEAHKCFDKAIRTNREYTEGYNQKAMLLMAEGRNEEALENFNLAVKYDSTYLQPLFNRAIVYCNLERYEEALEDYKRVVELNEYVVGGYYNMAIVYAIRGEWPEALENYDKVIYHAPDNVKGYFNRAGVYAELGRYAEALGDYSKAIELYPDFANAYLSRALVKDRIHDLAGASHDRAIAARKIEEYEARLEENPDELSIYADTSRHFNQLVSFESKLAERRLQEGQEGEITLRPMFRFTLSAPTTVGSHRYYVEPLEEFGMALADTNIVFSCSDTSLTEEEIAALNAAYEKEALGDGWQPLFKHGISQLCVRQYTSALGLLSDAIALLPDNPFLYLNRAVARAEMIDFISSINRSDRISIDSEMKPGHVVERKYNYNDAIADLNSAIELAPEVAYLYYNRANLHALSGDMPAAYDDYTRAIELAPELAEAWFNRGLVQLYMKDTRKGCIDLSKAGELGIKEAYTVLKRYNRS